MAGSTAALITCKEDEGPSHGINSTPLSECRGLVPVLAVTVEDFLLANDEHDLVSATHKNVEGATLRSVMLHIPVDMFIWM